MNSGEFESVLPPEYVNHLRKPSDGLCWWCRSQPATTGEHKFKASDLTRMMSRGELLWGDSTGRIHGLRGKSAISRDRHGVVKFPKSLCAPCNNARSQPFDLAYDQYSNYLAARQLHSRSGIDFKRIYGKTGWEQPVMNLGRYYGKHFGCQMVHQGIPVPDSLRDFLDGASDMPDIHMVLVTTDSLHAQFKNGLTISPGVVWTDPQRTEIRSCIFAAYIGTIGVRFEWQAEAIPDEHRSQFFHYPHPILNKFENEEAVARGNLRPSWFARHLQRKDSKDAGELERSGD